ncbi:MAG: hypothetical protein ACR2QK_10525, partial [Acidimicrobiales bacterium]
RVAAALTDVFIDFEPIERPAGDPGAGHRHVVTKKLAGTQTTSLADYGDYDRKIWICRDPRDFLVSQSLYRWHREQPPEPIDQLWFDRVFEKLVTKESDPASVSFLDLEPANYFETLDAVADLCRREIDDSWLVYRYEHMVDGDYRALNHYLGFEVEPEAEVARGLERVVRRKGYGDWRDWFTPADVAFYSSGGLQRYLCAFGYDGHDWQLNDPQSIDPEHGSRYMAALFNDHLSGTGDGRPDEERESTRNGRWFSLWSNRA